MENFERFIPQKNSKKSTWLTDLNVGEKYCVVVDYDLKFLQKELKIRIRNYMKKHPEKSFSWMKCKNGFVIKRET